MRLKALIISVMTVVSACFTSEASSQNTMDPREHTARCQQLFLKEIQDDQKVKNEYNTMSTEDFITAFKTGADNAEQMIALQCPPGDFITMAIETFSGYFPKDYDLEHNQDISKICAGLERNTREVKRFLRAPEQLEERAHALIYLSKFMIFFECPQ